MPRNGRTTGSSFSELPSSFPCEAKKRQTNLIQVVLGGLGRTRVFVCFIVYMFKMFVAIFLYLISCSYEFLRQDFAVKGQDFAVKGQDFAVKGQDFAVKGQDFAVKGQDFRVFSVEC
jgi:hypothetical protein